MEAKLAVFKGKGIRRTLYNNEWWFSVSDIVEILTETVNSSGYIKKMRKRDNELSKGWGQIVTPFSIQTDGGTQRIKNRNPWLGKGRYKLYVPFQ
jgi:DNA-damage-inducible protein D